MSWFATFYDRVMAPTEEACLHDWRHDLLANAHGDVLEIGAGTGVNVTQYGSHVRSVTFCEPDDDMRERLEEKLRDEAPGWDYRVTDALAEDLPFADASFDTLVSTLVLCSVQDPDRVMTELQRVSRPAARLIFLEHVGAESGSRRRWFQGAFEPIWKRAAGNCHLTRDTATTIGAAFDIEHLQAESMRKAFSLVRPTIRGVAIVRE